MGGALKSAERRAGDREQLSIHVLRNLGASAGCWGGVWILGFKFSRQKFADFEKLAPGTSSLAPSMAACSVKADAESPRRRPGQKAGTEVGLYRGLGKPPSFCAPLQGMKI
eukprot:1148444-Pelagomonas_calceolata.AAC.1